MPRYDRQRDPMADLGIALVAFGAIAYGLLFILGR
jgi:hypothetical protein